MTRPFFAPRSARWVPGNHFELLENGEEFFPRVFDAIANARHPAGRARCKEGAGHNRISAASGAWSES